MAVTTSVVTMTTLLVNATATIATVESPPIVDDTNCALVGHFVINTVVAGLLCLLGLLGNSLCFLVLRKDQDTPIASFLLQTLACCDNAFLGLWLLHFSLRDLFSFMHLDGDLHVAWMYVILYTYPLLFVAQSATIWLTVLIAVYRYLAVCKPYTVHLRMDLLLAKKGVVGVIIFAFVYNLPRYFDTTIDRDKQQHQQHPVSLFSFNHSINASSMVVTAAPSSKDYMSTKYEFSHTALGKSALYSTIYLDILYYVFSLFLPLLILAMLNTRLTMAYRALQLRRRQRWRQRGFCRCSGDEAQMSEQNITRVLILVVLVFMLCNAPARAVQMIWRYAHQPCPSAAFILMEVSNVLEVFLSSLNFVIYCVFRKQFRYILRHRLCISDEKVRTQRSRAMSLALSNGGSVPTTLVDLPTPASRRRHPDHGSSGSALPLLKGGSRKTVLIIRSELVLKVTGGAQSARCHSF